ncbi:MAG: PepSY-associated TM helix domain-containing protein [Pseudomonadota bacterium]
MATKGITEPAVSRNEARGLRQVMSVVHTWSSLVPLWVLYFVFITGSVGYFHIEVSNWMKPEIEHVAEPVDELAVAAQAESYLSENAAEASRWTISFPYERKETASLTWSGNLSAEETQELTAEERAALQENSNGSVDLNPASGAVYSDQVRETGGGNLLYRMHYVLHYVSRTAGESIVVMCTFLMFAALVSGIIIHKKIFKDFFTFRPAKGQRSWLDAHNIFSVMTLPFQLMITYSGLLFSAAIIMPLMIYGPLAMLGFDVDNLLSANSPDDLSPKNRELAEIAAENALGRPLFTPPAGAKADMVPLSELASDFRARHPDQPVSMLVVDNPNRENALATIQSSPALDRQPEAREVYNAVTGIALGDSSETRVGVDAGGIQGVILALHEGHFSPIVLRWLYLLSGLAGAGMIASGAILWVRKRRQAYEAALKRYAKKNGDTDKAETPQIGKGVVFVEQMNVSTIIGLPIGIAVYFLANRLIPLSLENRGSLEADAMFIAWALTFMVAIIRPGARIWSELMWIACIAFAAIPLVNAFTTDRHLGISLSAGDWMMAGFDLTMLAISAVFALAALISGQRQGSITLLGNTSLKQQSLSPAE